MRSKEFAHGFDLSGSVDRFLRKGSFGKDDYRPCAPSIKLHQPPLPKREGRTAPSRSEIDCIACILRFRRLAAACLVVLCAVLPRLGAIPIRFELLQLVIAADRQDQCVQSSH